MLRPLALIVEDEADIREIIRYNLEREGYRVRETSSGEEALVDVRKHPPDVILLDLMLPGIQGLEVCRRLRASGRTRDTPLIMVTAKGEEADVVAGLEMGADDFVAKPFSPRELVARVRSVLRRGRTREGDEDSATIRIDTLEIDPVGHEVRDNGEPVHLTLAEFRLLWTLASNPGRAFNRAQLVRHLTGGDHHIIERNVDVHVRALRRKLGSRAKMIGTVRGVGYRFRD